MAIDKKLQIILAAKDTTDKAFQTAMGRVKKLQKAVMGLAAGYALHGLSRSMSEWAQLAGKQQEAVAGLTQAMMSMGRYTPELHKKLIDTASALQDVTTFGDEATIMGQKFLVTYQDISDKILPRATKVMLDLAALMGGDTTRAANMLGKASMGLTGELRRVGITIDQATFKAKGFAGVLGEIEKQVGGQAEALAKTGIGPWKQLANIWGDAKEDLGELTLQLTKEWMPMLRAWAELVKKIAGYWTQALTPPDMMRTLEIRRTAIVEKLGKYERLAKRPYPSDYLKMHFGFTREELQERIRRLNAELRNVSRSIQLEIDRQKPKLSVPAPGSGEPVPGSSGIKNQEVMQNKSIQSSAEFLKTKMQQLQAFHDVALQEQQNYQREIAQIQQAAFLKEMDLLDQAMSEESQYIEQALEGIEDKGRKTFAALKDKGRDAFSELDNAMQGWANNWSRSLNDMVWEAKFSFKDIGESFTRMITQMAIQYWVVKPLFSNVFEPLSKDIGGFFKRLVPFAAGGVVTEPTLFPLRQGAGLMAEAGPEAVMPLARLPGGDLGVKAISGNVEVHVHNYAGAQVDVRQQRMTDGGRRIDVVIDEVVAQKISGGGRSFNAIRKTFNLSPMLHGR